MKRGDKTKRHSHQEHCEEIGTVDQRVDQERDSNQEPGNLRLGGQPESQPQPSVLNAETRRKTADAHDELGDQFVGMGPPCLVLQQVERDDACDQGVRSCTRGRAEVHERL